MRENDEVLSGLRSTPPAMVSTGTYGYASMINGYNPADFDRETVAAYEEAIRQKINREMAMPQLAAPLLEIQRSVQDTNHRPHYRQPTRSNDNAAYRTKLKVINDPSRKR